MKTTTRIARIDSAELQQLAERLSAWRSTRTRRERIPEELWKGAADLARVHGLNPTAEALKLPYYGLQRRLLDGRVQRRQRVPASPFVELTAPTMPGEPSEGGTLELVQRSGARLTLRLPDANIRDLLPVVHLFLRHRS
jgi:hypothetical protein